MNKVALVACGELEQRAWLCGMWRILSSAELGFTRGLLRSFFSLELLHIFEDSGKLLGQSCEFLFGDVQAGKARHMKDRFAV
jgi:hypothetical protein